MRREEEAKATAKRLPRVRSRPSSFAQAEFGELQAAVELESSVYQSTAYPRLCSALEPEEQVILADRTLGARPSPGCRSLARGRAARALAFVADPMTRTSFRNVFDTRWRRWPLRQALELTANLDDAERYRLDFVVRTR